MVVKSITIELEVKNRLARLRRELSLQLGRRCSYRDVLRYLLDLAEDEARWRIIQQ